MYRETYLLGAIHPSQNIQWSNLGTQIFSRPEFLLSSKFDLIECNILPWQKYIFLNFNYIELTSLPRCLCEISSLLSKWTLESHSVFFSKMGVKMNLRIITRNYAGDPEKRVFDKIVRKLKNWHFWHKKKSLSEPTQMSKDQE